MSSFIEKLREFAVLIRIQNLGTSVTAGIGALSVKGNSIELLDFFMLFLMAVIINVGGQIINDIKDIEIDKNSNELQNRPLVKGTISLKTSKIVIISCLILLLFIAFVYFGGVLALLVLFSSMFVGYLYNVFSKKIPGSDTFLSLSFALFCIYGAIVVTDNFQGFEDITALTWVVSALVFVHVQIMNSMEGGLKDAKNDRETGAKTLAVFLGVKADDKNMFIPFSFKAINMFFVFLTVILAFVPIFFFDITYSIGQLIILVLLIVWMLFSAFKLISMKTFDKKKIKFHIRNHELTRYALVPIILFNFIGIWWVLFLIFEPIVWFVLTNYLFYKESWSKPKLY